MILCEEKKVAFLYNPKTGSSTMSKLLEVAKSRSTGHAHELTINKFVKDPENYKLYAFYREPVERYISAVNYIKKSKEGMYQILQYFFGVGFSSAKVVGYDNLSDELRFKIDSLSPIKYLEVFLKNNLVLPVFYKQISWLDKPNMTLLDYRDFDNNARFVCNLFDVKVDKIPWVNQSVKINNVSELNSRDISEIRDYYKEDYVFLESRGIRFESDISLGKSQPQKLS